MVMGSARRDLASGDKLTLRAMLSPDPFMGKRGYPLLLAAGETADGVTPLVDRQHPHDFFMELSASYAWQAGEGAGAFVYAGLPGEPAFGPPAFMHRPAAMMSPEAPITHHWLDSTHISFGVVTAGWVQGRWKLEASQFTGREPDEDRYDIERPRMDSTALRASWNPGDNWSLQASWADVESPEQLEPEVDEKRMSASALYGRDMGGGRSWSATIAFGRKNPNHGDSTDAFAFEAAWVPAIDWQVFARAEWIETHELGDDDHEIHEVGKLSVGARRDFALTERLRLGLGALYAFNEVDAALAPLVRRRQPERRHGLRAVPRRHLVAFGDCDPGRIRIVGVDRGDCRLGVLAEVFLEHHAILVDDEGHHAACAVIGWPGDQREAVLQHALVEVFERAAIGVVGLPKQGPVAIAVVSIRRQPDNPRLRRSR